MERTLVHWFTAEMVTTSGACSLPDAWNSIGTPRWKVSIQPHEPLPLTPRVHVGRKLDLSRAGTRTQALWYGLLASKSVVYPPGQLSALVLDLEFGNSWKTCTINILFLRDSQCYTISRPDFYFDSHESILSQKYRNHHIT